MTGKTTATLLEIAAALGISRQAANKRAGKDAWAYQEETVRGGRQKVYPLATLPAAVGSVVYMYMRNQEESHDQTDTGNSVDSAPAGRGGDSAVQAAAVAGGDQLGRHVAKRSANGNHLVAQQNSGQCVVMPAAGTGVHFDPADLTDHQRQTDYARRAIREFVESYPGSVKGALNHLNINAADGVLNKRMAWACDACHDKKRAGQQLNTKTYYNWLAIKAQRGSLAPAKKAKQVSIQPWHVAAIALRQRPQGSTLTWIHEQLTTQKYAVSYDQVARFFREQFSALDQLKGRYTGSKLRSHKFYQHRTNAGLAPADEVHADGWNTHFSAPHPVTGEFVTYEVWHFHDVATRYVTPPGIGLSEQFEVIAKGLENYIRVFGRLLILQTDSTKIIKGSERFTRGIHSLEERIGCTIVHPKEVGNSQANGICENFNSSWLDKQSRELATYQNPKQMDELSFKRVKKLTGAMVKAANAGDLALRDQKKREAERMGRGLVFTSPEQARDWIERICEAFNDRPHRSLPKINDAATGKRRHQTPREALTEHIAHGWEPVAVDADTLIDLFRPHTVVKVTRETVTPYGGMRYRNPDVLGHWNGKEVVVAYDIHDYQRVWVKDLHGAPICEAEFVHATGYRAKTAYDDAEEKRAKAQLAANARKAKTILERRPQAALEDAESHVKSRIDFLDLDALQVKPEREKTILDFLPETPAEKVREATYADTLLWLAGKGDKPGGEAPPEKEAAAR